MAEYGKHLWLKRHGLRIFSRILILSFVIAFLGSCGGSDSDVMEESAFINGAVRGIAYYPSYEDGNGFPVYYDDDNYDIQVALHDESGEPLELVYTPDSGWFLFRDVPPGFYFLTAYIDEYNETEGVYYVYEAESNLFHLASDETIRVDLMLEFDHTEE